MTRGTDRKRRWPALPVLAGMLFLAGHAVAAPVAAPRDRTDRPAAEPGAPEVASECAPRVVEVRLDAVHAATGPGCGLAPGARLVAPDGAALVVTDASSGWVRLVVQQGPAPRVGQRLDVVPGDGPPAPPPAPSGARRAGPGATSRIAPASLFTDAADRRVPRTAAAVSVPSGLPGGTGAVQVHGRLGAGVTGVADLSDRGAGWWRPFLESTLDLERPGAVTWNYRHRLRGQYRFDGRAASQPWDADEPRVGLHELQASASFLDRRLTVGLGRLAPGGVAGAATVDGAVLEGRVADGVHAGVFGGLLPHPTRLLPGLDGTGFGAWIRGTGRAGAARLSGSLLVSGTTWKGALDETRADARFAVSAGRRFDAWLLTRIDAWPTGAPGTRAVVDLSRLAVGILGRPAQRLDLGARFAWHRWTATRRARDLWGQPFASPSTPAVGIAGLDVRWEPVDGLALRAEGDVDVTGPAATGWSTGGAVAYTVPGRTPWSFEARYRYQDADHCRGHHAGGEVRLPVHPALGLEVGYRFSRYESIASEPSLEHDARLGLAARLHRSLHLLAAAEWIQGDDVMALFASGRLDWRF